MTRGEDRALVARLDVRNDARRAASVKTEVREFAEALRLSIDDEHEYRERITKPAPGIESLLELKRVLQETLTQADRTATALNPYATAGGRRSLHAGALRSMKASSATE